MAPPGWALLVPRRCGMMQLRGLGAADTRWVPAGAGRWCCSSVTTYCSGGASGRQRWVAGSPPRLLCLCSSSPRTCARAIRAIESATRAAPLAAQRDDLVDCVAGLPTTECGFVTIVWQATPFISFRWHVSRVISSASLARASSAARRLGLYACAGGAASRMCWATPRSLGMAMW
jgi:hypothetical protein